MTTIARAGRSGDHRWRIAAWGGAAVLLLMPLIAMRFDAGVDWTASDFVAAAVLLAGTGALLELAMRASASVAWRTGAAVAIGTALLLVWVNLAVGVIGSERDPANLAFVGVLAVGAGGAFAVRLHADGMARAMIATAAAQSLVGAIALALDGDRAIVPATVAFTAAWLASAWLFRRAYRTAGGRRSRR